MSNAVIKTGDFLHRPQHVNTELTKATYITLVWNAALNEEQAKKLFEKISSFLPKVRIILDFAAPAVATTPFDITGINSYHNAEEFISRYAWNCNSFEFLSDFSNLIALEITETKSKKLTHNYLRTLKKLLRLDIESQLLVLDHLPDLHGIIDLTLHKFKLRNLDFIPLNVRNLDIRYGSIDSLSTFSKGTKIQFCNLVGIGNIRDFEGIDFKNIELLHLTSLSNLTSLKGIEKLESLRGLGMSQNKKLKDFGPLKKLLNLEYLRIIDTDQYALEDYEIFKEIPNLKKIGIGVQSLKKQEKLKHMFKDKEWGGEFEFLDQSPVPPILL